MSAELFYLVGKSNSLKQVLVAKLKERIRSEASIFIPDVYTTDEAVAEGENYKYLADCDFNLRHSMGMYCLSWEKNEHKYGVGADIIQRLNAGVDVVLNGSLRNIDQAAKQFPNLNTVLVKKQGHHFEKARNQYVIAEEDDVRLEWYDRDDMGHPYVLTLESENSTDKAVNMLLNLVTYERGKLDEVI